MDDFKTDFTTWTRQELKELLLQYNINPEDVKGTGRHGRRRKSDYIKRIKKIHQFTVINNH